MAPRRTPLPRSSPRSTQTILARHGPATSDQRDGSKWHRAHEVIGAGHTRCVNAPVITSHHWFEDRLAKEPPGHLLEHLRIDAAG